MDFDREFEDRRARVETALNVWTPSADTRPARIHAAMRHSLDAGGKRLRPVLLCASFDLCGGERSPGAPEPEPAAIAVECLHTYSLIHDDLPCMDDSALRRGLPSCHVAFDEATAVLTGDALLTLAFQILGKAYAAHPHLQGPLVAELAEAAGSTRLIGGQMEDILGETRDLSAQELDFIHANKTAALISATLGMGAITAGAPEEHIARARRVGLSIGLAFQIIDDVLDATGDAIALGKAVNQDSRNEKNTYVKIHGLDQSRIRARELTAVAVSECSRFPGDPTFFTTLIQRLEHRLT